MFPAEFINGLRESLGLQRAERVLEALATEPPVSVRVNPFKRSLPDLRAHFGPAAAGPVDWAPAEGFYLQDRPSFTLDPWFHAGAYYVQEASSMYVGLLFDRAAAALGGTAGLRVLDLCAAPGGKTTQLLSHLDETALLVANEVVPARAAILAENVARWGSANVVVSRSDPSAFTALRGLFDVAVVDAPCSGEGMFRKDARAVAEWSPATVRLCAARQRRILADMWPALSPGGFLIYSTCTFNASENEDNVAWAAAELGAEILEMRHFYPGDTEGEGFFAALLRKAGAWTARPAVSGDLTLTERAGRLHAFPKGWLRTLAQLDKSLKILAAGVAVATCKGPVRVPEADFALANHLVPVEGLSFEKVSVTREQALQFLAREPLYLPDSPRGYLLLCQEGLGLGFVKNLGTRTNSLLPAGRRIRMTIPQ